MTILEALQNKQIRYARGVEFSDTDKPGYCVHWSDLQPETIMTAEEAHAADYVGAKFVRFDEQLPADIPVNNPAHCWAYSVQVGDKYVPSGALVVWSTDEKENAWRAAQPQPQSFADFNAARHG